jgi:hypothetical protein
MLSVRGGESIKAPAGGRLQQQNNEVPSTKSIRDFKKILAGPEPKTIHQ